MTDKKRKTITTIETHEVWILRKLVPEPADAQGMHSPTRDIQAETVSTLSTANNDSEASDHVEES
jgi:hypothetical protein